MPTIVHMASQCASKSYQKSSVVKEHHVHKFIRIPDVGEELVPVKFSVTYMYLIHVQFHVFCSCLSL